MTRLSIDVTPDDLIDTLSFFDSWEDRYRYIIDLGKMLVEQDASFRTDERLVRGCQSQVWMDCEPDGDQLYVIVDSDAHIVKGLLYVVLVAYHGKTPTEILAWDMEGFFTQLDLIKHLSPTRGNGLRAMVKRIQHCAQAALVG
jgi:cysteine desulfuration protein SufE